jgi:hypothetical protein
MGLGALSKTHSYYRKSLFTTGISTLAHLLPYATLRRFCLGRAQAGLNFGSGPAHPAHPNKICLRALPKALPVRSCLWVQCACQSYLLRVIPNDECRLQSFHFRQSFLDLGFVEFPCQHLYRLRRTGNRLNYHCDRLESGFELVQRTILFTQPLSPERAASTRNRRLVRSP